MKLHFLQRSFYALLGVQFLGAFNDNVWKVVVTLVLIEIAKSHGADYSLKAQQYSSFVFFVFTFPFLIFSIPAGRIADRMRKSTLIVWTKISELLIMILAFALLLFGYGGFFLLVVLGLMATQSAFFGPAKYSILPELLPRQKLTAANAHLQTWTLLAIIMGSACGGFLLELCSGSMWSLALVLMMVSFLALLGSFWITPCENQSASKPTEKTLSMKACFHYFRHHPLMWLSTWSVSFAWLIVSQASQNILVYGKVYLGASDSLSALPMGVFGAGVAFGSFSLVWISSERKQFQATKLGMLLFAVVHAFLATLPSYPFLLLLSFVFGLANGLWMTPLQVFLQDRSPDHIRASLLGMSNWLSFVGIFLGSLFVGVTASMGMSLSQTFMLVSVLVCAALFVVHRYGDMAEQELR
ncbi:MAG: MFS transporter [Bdellovibrionales bacterium]|nr:MFS transporter [Bdellovibrionales bacterium]